MVSGEMLKDFCREMRKDWRYDVSEIVSQSVESELGGEVSFAADTVAVEPISNVLLEYRTADWLEIQEPTT